MSAATDLITPPPAWTRRLPLGYGWVMVALAALAMVATLPGRTQGLGLITEPLLRDLKLDRIQYAQLNLWTTLLGATFCLGFGRLLDRWGARCVLTLVAAALGLAVVGMSFCQTPAQLAVALGFIRGLGQSALSAVSISLVGQWFRDGSPRAMATYSLLLSFGFMLAFPLLGAGISTLGWRVAWFDLGIAVLVVGVLAWVFGRDSAKQAGVAEPSSLPGDRDFTATAALKTPAFWVFGLGGALYGLVASGIGLFNENILGELGFPPALYHRTLAVTALTGLAGNFLGGWLGQRCPPRVLMTGALTLLAAGLLALPHLRQEGTVYAQAVLMGLSGGLVTVIFFGYWVATFGRSALGVIQGSAQALTVAASAVGPLLLVRAQQATGSYAACFQWLALATLLMAALAAVVPQPIAPSRTDSPRAPVG
jgi:MFS family permease